MAIADEVQNFTQSPDFAQRSPEEPEDVSWKHGVESLSPVLTKGVLPIVIISLIAESVSPGTSKHTVESALKLIEHLIVNLIGDPSLPLYAGLTVGFLQSLVLRMRTFGKLEGKTAEGNLESSKKVTGLVKRLEVLLQCVDGRRESTEGGAVPGTHGVLGGFIEAVIASMVMNDVGGRGLDAFIGYALGSTIYVFIQQHLDLFIEIDRIAENTSGPISIESLLHNLGCGAQGFNGIGTNALKFDLHLLTLEDIRNLDRDLLGTIYANIMITTYCALRYGGRVKFNAHMIKRTKMKHAH